MFDDRGDDREARADRPRPERQRRQVPPRRARPAVHAASISGRTRASSRSSTPTARSWPRGSRSTAAARCCPVNWRGDGQEFVLLSGNAREGGHDRRPAAPGGDVPRRRPPRPGGHVRDVTATRATRSSSGIGSGSGSTPRTGRSRASASTPRAATRLQRVELPHGGLASGMGRGGVAVERPGEATMKRPRGGVVTVVLALALSTTSARSADWYVTPQGRADRAGTAEAPWDIASALEGATARSAGGYGLDRSGHVSRGPQGRRERL